MSDQWMKSVKLDIGVDQFEQLPQHGAFRYEYHDDHAWLIPRPQYYHARLDLRSYRPGPVARDVVVRSLEERDWEHLPTVFASAFQGVQPYGSLNEAEMLEAGRASLERTRTRGDGPLIESASMVGAFPEDGTLIGGALITLLPLGSLEEYDTYYWLSPPPPDAIERKLGQPHLTWIFVARLFAGSGLGTALLNRIVEELRRLGFTELVSTFLKGNESSMLWHWRNGFELVMHPTSKRRGAKVTRPQSS